jgi:hypothetical protein
MAFPAVTTTTTNNNNNPKDQNALKLACANCKHSSHSTDFCVAPGGKTYGRTREARGAQKTAFSPLDPELHPVPNTQPSSTIGTWTGAILNGI